MLGRTLRVITSKPNEATSSLYRPFEAIGKESTLLLGHIQDHHFIPLQLKGRL